MDYQVDFLDSICYNCKSDSENLFNIEFTCALQKKLEGRINFDIIFRGSRLCYKCLKSIKSKVKSSRFIKCEKCSCYYEYRDAYLASINHCSCPTCQLPLSQCWKHGKGKYLFKQTTIRLACQECCSRVILKQLLMNIVLFLISPFLIFFTGIDGVEQWPCWFQAFFFILLPFTFPFAIAYIVIQKFLAIFYSLFCLLQVWRSKEYAKTIWDDQL